MSAEQLTAEALALPLAAQVALAQTLWESINQGVTDPDEAELTREFQRREEELSSGRVVGRIHEEVMQAARRALGCA